MDAVLLKQAGDCLASWARTMILTHARADGDALGSMGAMQRVITAAGRSATAFVFEPVGLRYRFLGENCPFTLWPADEPAALDARFDGILILDTCSWSQLEPASAYLKASRLPRIVVDHHVTRDDLAGAGSQVEVLIDPTSASAAGLVYAWCEAMGWPLDAGAAEALFVGLSTDTGWFRFSNTDPVTMRAAAALLEAGVRPDRLYGRLFETHRPARLRLMGHTLSTIQFHGDGVVAIMWISPEMFALAEATSADSEEMVNEPMAIEGIVMSILLVDEGTGPIRMNFRSKAPEVCGLDVDVAALATRFGGGGHRRAAGARVEGELATVRDQVIAAAVAAVTKAKPG